MYQSENADRGLSLVALLALRRFLESTPAGASPPAADSDQEQLFQMGFDQCTIGMVTWSRQGVFTRVNPAFAEMVGIPADELAGKTVESLIHPDEAVERMTAIEALKSGRSEGHRTERRYVRPDGTVVWGRTDTSAIYDKSGEIAYFFSQVQDITERKQIEVALEYQARHDPVTGLPNRFALENTLRDALKGGGGTARMAVLSVGVDHSKLLNDRLGHAAGDEVLVAVALRLADLADPHPVFRMSGDWFVVLIEGLEDPDEAVRLGEELLTVSSQSVRVAEMALHITVSCGVAVVDCADTAEDAIRDAETAMSWAKHQGRSRVEVFDGHLRRIVTDRFDIEHQLRRAIDERELRVAYQPIVGLADGGVVGVEALVRWQHPERGLLSPAAFISVAEESGLIVGIGEFVMEEALRQIVSWRAALPGCEALWASVNISARQLAPGNPVALCKKALAATGAPVDALHIEVTETTVMTDVESSIRQLRALRKLGVAVAMDDFGTGYSSLAYLSNLPVETIKIDRSFVADLDRGKRSAKIVRAIALLSSELQVQTCAEGVETAEQRAILADLGCQLGQGYYWAKPLPPEEFAARFKQ